MTRTKPRLSVARRLLYAAITILLLFGVAEATCRLSWPRLSFAGVFPRDATLRWVLPAGGRADVGRFNNRINSLGYRGPEVSATRGRCSLRVLGTGDSSVYGHDIADGSAFLELLNGARLGKLEVEAINGGVPGYSTYQTLLQLEHGGWDLRPDLLIMANLWSDGSMAPDGDKDFFLHGVEAHRTVGGKLLRLMGHSKLYTLAVSTLHGPRVMYSGAPEESVMTRRVPLAEYRANLRRMVTEVRRRGGEALFLMLPHASDQVKVGGVAREMRQDLRRRGVREEAHDYRSVMRTLSKELSVVLLQMPEKVSAEPRSLFHDDLHPNAMGHKLIARYLRDVLNRHPELRSSAQRRCAGQAR